VNCFSGSFQSIAFGPILRGADSQPACDIKYLLRFGQPSSAAGRIKSPEESTRQLEANSQYSWNCTRRAQDRRAAVRDVGVEAADVVGDVCFQGAVRDFGQDPVAVGGGRGRCRVRCQQAIDSCGVCAGTSFPRVVVEGGASRLSFRRGQDVRIGATIQWNNTACASSHELVYQWDTPFSREQAPPPLCLA
jgi:hypothetical protein